MPVRIEFTPQDLVRTRIGPPLGAFGETLHALGLLAHRRSPDGHPGLPQLRSRSTGRDRDLASFLWLSPTVGLDLFTLLGPTRRLDDSRAQLLDLDQSLFAAEADLWAHARQKARKLGVLKGRPQASRPVVPPGLREGTVDSRRQLSDDVARFYEAAIAPHWSAIDNRLLTEQARLMAELGAYGVEAMWSTMSDVCWSDLALDLPFGGVTASGRHRVRLGGRGLVVRPSFFASRPGLYMPTDCSSASMLIVPCRPDERTDPVDGRRGEEVSLLGPTRTAVLAAIARGPQTTTGLSQSVGISISGASQHASVLRRGGLIQTSRHGGRVLHVITELGRRVLRQT